MLPVVISAFLQFLVSSERIRQFLLSEESDSSGGLKLTFETTGAPENAAIVQHSNASFAWSRQAVVPTLSDINLLIKPGSLTAIVGQVGAGKSSLCTAILGQLDRLSGAAELHASSVAFVPQQAWIQNASVKDNILFGHKLNDELYEKVIYACALQPDFDLFPAGDATEIGEKGLNLSGGQKQRVSLARAAYSSAQLIVLDDPLSAVDAHVAKHIFDNLLSNDTGLLRHKTRILATHSIGFLPYVDQIVVLDRGRIAETGTYRQLLKHNGAFAVLLRNYLDEAKTTTSVATDTEGEDKKEVIKGQQRRNSDLMLLPSPNAANLISESGDKNAQETAASRRRHRLVSQNTVQSHTSTAQNDSRHKLSHSSINTSNLVTAACCDDEDDDGRLVSRESSARGRANKSVYVTYARQSSYALSLITISSYFAYYGVNVLSQLWLAQWSASFTRYEELRHSGKLLSREFLTSERNWYIFIYFLLGIGQAVFIVLKAIFITITTIRASRKLHQRMLDRIMRAPMSFFDTTPIGRILNRFSKDLDTVDVTLPDNLRSCLECIVIITGTLFIICYSAPWFVVSLPFLLGVFFLVQRFYVTTSCQLRRLDLVARAPVFSFFTESMQGVQVVRAMQAQRRFIREFDTRIDGAARPMFCNAVCTRWISVWLNFLGAAVVLIASLCVIVLKRSELGDAIEASILGLVISNATAIAVPLQWATRTFSEVDTDIVSVERIVEYSNVPQEAPWTNTLNSSQVSAQWPERGKIEFNNYKTRYRPGLRLVLQGVSATVTPSEKMGIVGRTGAGKSSLTLALFRLIEAASEEGGDESGGYIAIDGVNIARLGLHDLRSRLTIIPQEPVLFSGTLRFNLDPAGAYGDDKVWQALEHAHLKLWVDEQRDGLEFMVAEEGSNMSVGQRQLVCLARALLRKTRVLVLDEATAAVDVETDELIQAAIRREFADSTVLTIAHRLNTILDYDRVMVMEDGKVKELAAPSELLKDEQSEFSKLARDANIGVFSSS